MKKYFILISVLVLFGLITTISIQSIRIKDLNNSLSTAVNNNKAYDAENSSLKEQNVVFKYTIQDLTHANDSINRKMIELSRELKVKDNRLTSLQYQLERVEKVDTIYFRDTIFRDKNLLLDTCLNDYWSTTCIHLKYPNELGVSSRFNNEKYIITSWKKEPIKQRKWFLSRWFTKKQKIITVDVIDKNPYVITEKQRFVEICK